MKNNKKIIVLLLIFLVGVMYVVSLIIDDNNYVVTEAKEPEEILTNEIVKEDIVKVDIKGAVNKPGVYEVDDSARVIDQTTTNMIQRISHLFAINPLISKEI